MKMWQSDLSTAKYLHHIHMHASDSVCMIWKHLNG